MGHDTSTGYRVCFLVGAFSYLLGGRMLPTTCLAASDRGRVTDEGR